MAQGAGLSVWWMGKQGKAAHMESSLSSMGLHGLQLLQCAALSHRSWQPLVSRETAQEVENLSLGPPQSKKVQTHTLLPPSIEP